MYREKLTIEGVKYVITHHDDGTTTEEPPLPAQAKTRFAANTKGIIDTGIFPGVQTDTAFHANRGSLLKQLGGDEAWAKKLAKTAKQKGGVITSDHTYISQLAAYPGDPAAFIPPGEGRGYIKKLCEKRGKSVTGSVEYQAPKQDMPKRKTRLAEDLVQSQMRRYRSEGRVDKSVSNKELRKIVIDTHGAKE